MSNEFLWPLKEDEIYRTAISRFLSRGKIPTLADVDAVYRAASTYTPVGLTSKVIVRNAVDNRIDMRKLCP